MNKYFLILLGFVVVGLAACVKTDNAPQFNPLVQAKADSVTIQTYIKTNKLDSVQAASNGVYYKIIKPGIGPYPNTSSTVNVNYSGVLSDGTVFAAPDSATSILTNFIAGWQIGIPHINTGGTILLLIPSGQGYGNTIQSKVPANSVLIFTCKLNSFTN